MHYLTGCSRGELDVAAVLLPEGKIAPPPLLTNIIATDRWEIVQGAAGNIDADWKSLGKAPWVLNPPGCKARANLIGQMDRAGFTPMISVEIHNMHLQLEFVQSGYGVRLLSARFIARTISIDKVEVLRPPSFDLHMSVAIMILACSETRIELPGQARFRRELTIASHVFALRDINHTGVRPNLDHEDIPRMPLLPRQ